MGTLRTWAVTTAIIAFLGVPAGLLWAEISPKVTYIVIRGQAVLADPEGQAPIATDGRFALIAVAAGLACGIAAYLAGGRGNDLPLLFGLAAGGLAASLLAWRLGHHIGLDGFQRAVRRAPDGRLVTGAAQLRATGIVVFWPVLSVLAYELLELVVRRLPPGDGRKRRGGEADEVGGRELDLQAAPTGGDVDGREP
ncbi:hypothetical protein [Actinomadura sp. NBRC 104412]|uniref:hypothetical protein n=1 Tax=Actinomadura sp. NBRC 104412 TaxID=3032203 RepID=UPI002555E2F3|nr:hypothetical protein [Actinomadura sp. NBRC 104412]